MRETAVVLDERNDSKTGEDGALREVSNSLDSDAGSCAVLGEDAQETPDASSHTRFEPELEENDSPHIGHNIEIGRRGENAAVRFLERRGYEIVERNWTCRAGEADIIARDGQTIVFVEVKTRTNCDKGLPAEAVDEAKRARYERIATQFLRGYNVVDVPVRFDIISLVVIASDRAMIRHHINAFSAQ